MQRPSLGFIVEGHCEYEAVPSFVGKVLGFFNFPIQNARGIGNILKNLEKELVYMVKYHRPKCVIICIDSKDGIEKGNFESCSDLKESIYAEAQKFLLTQKNGSLILPERIVIVLAHTTFDSWLCSDPEGLKNCELIDSTKVFESYDDVDSQIKYPNRWIRDKLKIDSDPKNRRNRKILASSIRPEFGKLKSRSFRKFVEEVEKNFV